MQKKRIATSSEQPPPGQVRRQWLYTGNKPPQKPYQKHRRKRHRSNENQARTTAGNRNVKKYMPWHVPKTMSLQGAPALGHCHCICQTADTLFEVLFGKMLRVAVFRTCFWFINCVCIWHFALPTNHHHFCIYWLVFWLFLFISKT